MTIKNKVINVPTILWQIIKTWEFNQLKNNSNRDITKLKNSILKNGFIAPFDCWKSKEEKHFVIDGTGRNLALLELETEGVEIPSLPVVFIDAKDLKEAKKFALQRSSTHGEITQSSLADFTIDFEPIELHELQIKELNFTVQDIEILETKDPDIDFDDINSTEHRERKFKDQLVCCPSCETKFNIQT